MHTLRKLLGRNQPQQRQPNALEELNAELLEKRILLSTVQVLAAGSEGGEQMRLLVDGDVVETWTVESGADSGLFQTFIHDSADTLSADQIRVEFTNDLYEPDAGVDRNLRVDAIVLDDVRFETEDPSVYSTGTWLPEDGVQPGNRQSEYLQANGYFQYSEASVDGTRVQVHARGDEGNEQFRLVINGVEAAVFTTSTQLETFAYNATGNVTADQVRVEFFGGNYDPGAGIDSNLIVDYISLDGVVYQSEDPSTFSTGTWTEANGIQPGFPESEWLHADGYFQYSSGSGDGSEIEIRARGNEGDETFQLLIDEVVVATYDVTTTNATYSYTASAAVALSDVRIQFINDRFDAVTGEDSNLIVDYITIDGEPHQTEAPTVFSTGTWLAEDGVVAGFRFSETLHTNGYFEYGRSLTNGPADFNGQPVYNRDGNLYFLTSADTGWEAAQLEAESFGGNLVAINDATEQAWLRDTFGTDPLWIGINDADAEGRFKWVSGEAVTYTNWAAGEPGASDSQDYGRMNSDAEGRWDDRGGSLLHFGVIEIGSGTDVVQNGLLGEYYDDLEFADTFTTRVDAIIDFDWNGAPIVGMGVENFSIRWTGQIQPEFSETYTFRTLSDDGIRLWIDDVLIIDEWVAHTETLHTGTITLEADTLYDIRLEHYELSAQAVARLEWSSTSQPWEVVPEEHLFASPKPSLNPNGTGFSTEVLASGLVEPVAFAVASDGRIFVTEKEGRVVIVENGEIISTFLDITDEVSSGGDRGLLGIALDPDFDDNGHIYLNFTEEIDPDNPDSTDPQSDAAGRLIRISTSSTNPNVADLTTRVEILTGHEMSDYTHSVGDVDFDNQGNLIFTWGDGGFDPDLRLASQDPDSKQGKLFRIDRFTFEGVPDNPFYDATDPNSTASKVWAVGIRNSWKMWVDRDTGDVYMGEVTDRGPEEINVLRADESTVLNFGWPYYEDDIRTTYGTVPANFEYERAFVALPHTNAGGGDAILGGAIFRGTVYPESYDERYFFANVNQGILYTAGQDGSYQIFGEPGDYVGVIDMQMGPDGHIWMLNLLTGNLERLVSDSPGTDNPGPIAQASASLTAGASPITVTLDGSTSFHGNGDAIEHYWDFDSDGLIDASGAIVSASYVTQGRAIATLIVVDTQGVTDSTTLEIDVLAAPDTTNLAFGRTCRAIAHSG